MFGDEPFSFYTHNGDEQLARQLGIADRSRWQGDNPRAGIKLGSVQVGEATVAVEVSSWPAQFWSFQIEREGVLEFVVETDSGGLGEYWALVEQLIARGDVSPEDRRMVTDLRPQSEPFSPGRRVRLSPLADR